MKIISLIREYRAGYRNGSARAKEAGASIATTEALAKLQLLNPLTDADRPAVWLYWLGCIAGAQGITPVLRKV